MTTEPPTAPPVDGPGSYDVLVPGTKLGAYRVVALLGRGGMGEVYEAFDERLARPVALKRISASRQADPDARARFWREARALAALRHPGIVTVHEIGEEAGSLFIAMELVRGRTLARIGGGAWPPRFALHVARALAAALGAAHSAGITHREVKPANVLVDDAGQVRVVDFGLARRTHDADEQLTASGAIVGTPGYMSPESVQGARVGPAADVFAIGTFLYKLLSDVHPFARESTSATALAVAGAVHVPLATLRPTLPAAVTAVVERCLRVDAAARFADGAALAAALEGPLAGLGGAVTPSELLRFIDALGAVSGGAVDTAHARAVRSASEGRPRRARPVLVAAVLGLPLLALGAWQLATPSEPPSVPPEVVAPVAPSTGAGETPTGAADATVSPRPSDHAGSVVASLPPRPAVAVLGLAPARPEDAAGAAVAADVLRVRLDEDPEHLVTPSLIVLQAMLPGGPPLGPTVPARRFARAGRGIGHIDVVVRGTYRAVPGGEVQARVELVDTIDDRILATREAKAEDAIALAEALTDAVLPLLGGARPAVPARLTRVPEAWQAWVDARAANERADAGAAHASIAFALFRDPRFGLAQAAQVPLFISEGRRSEALEITRALLAEPDALPARDAGVMRAHQARLEGKTEEALREATRVTERWPFDIEAAALLMAIRAKDDRLQDLAEVERVAKRVLTFAPALEEPASRLIRTLGTRHRIGEAEALLAATGVPRDDPSWVDVWAELDMFAGRFDAAAAGYRKALALEPDNSYSENMAIAADILGDQCADAAGAALDRIGHFTALGTDSNLDWTYSLASQALICAERWEALESLLAQWDAFSESGRTHGGLLRVRVAWLRARVDGGEAYAPVARRIIAMLADPATSTPVQAALVSLFARFGDDRALFAKWRERARRDALDPAIVPLQRAGWRSLERALDARLAMLSGAPEDEVLRLYEACVPDWATLTGEGGARVDGLLRRADARAAHGDTEGARSDYAEIVGIGYERLWVTDQWIAAKRALAPP